MCFWKSERLCECECKNECDSVKIGIEIEIVVRDDPI